MNETYDILKKHETILNHYHISLCSGNGWGDAVREIASVVNPTCCMHCGAAVGEMMNTAWSILQRMEKERAQNQISNEKTTEEKPKASEPKKRGNPNFGKKQTGQA